jgi:hypothetical protein
MMSLALASDFKGDMVVKNYLDRCGREELYGAIRAATLSPNDKALDIVMMKYGEKGPAGSAKATC